MDTLAARDAITAERRDWMMEVNVLADGKKYTLTRGADLLDNTLWQEVVGGAGAAVTEWKAGVQKANSLVTFDGNLYRVKSAIANGQSTPVGNAQYYQQFVSADQIPPTQSLKNSIKVLASAPDYAVTQNDFGGVFDFQLRADQGNTLTVTLTATVTAANAGSQYAFHFNADQVGKTLVVLGKYANTADTTKVELIQLKPGDAVTINALAVYGTSWYGYAVSAYSLAGTSAVIEQNLFSNSTTSIPSVAAVKALSNSLVYNYIPVGGTANGVTVAGEIEIGHNGSFLYRDSVAGGFVRTRVEDGLRMEFVDANYQNVNEIDFSMEGIYLTAPGAYVQMLAPNGSLVSLTASNTGTLLVNGNPIAAGSGGSSVTIVQDLTSNSTTSVPSVKAVAAADSNLQAQINTKLSSATLTTFLTDNYSLKSFTNEKAVVPTLLNGVYIFNVVPNNNYLLPSGFTTLEMRLDATTLRHGYYVTLRLAVNATASVTINALEDWRTGSYSFFSISPGETVSFAILTTTTAYNKASDWRWTKISTSLLPASGTTRTYVDAADASLQSQIITQKNRIDTLVTGAPAALDTLKEIADQLAKDETGAAAILATQQQHTQQLAQMPVYGAGLVQKNQAGVMDVFIGPGLAVEYDDYSLQVNFTNDINSTDGSKVLTTAAIKAAIAAAAGSGGTGTSGTSIKQTPAYAITKAGQQVLSLPEVAAGIVYLSVVEDGGGVRLVYEDDYILSGSTLTISAEANLVAGDTVRGKYFLAAVGGGTSGTSIKQTPAYQIAQAGQQILSLPEAAAGIVYLSVVEDGGGVRLIYEDDYSLSGSTLTVSVEANLRPGDTVRGKYFLVAAASPGPDTGTGGTGDTSTGIFPILQMTKGSDQTVGIGFQQLAYDNQEIDTDSTWNGSVFTVPVGGAGIYECFNQIRLADNYAQGVSFGIGIDRNMGDTARFSWFMTPTSTTAQYIRQGATAGPILYQLAEGEQLKGFVYSDGGLNITSTRLVIKRIK